MAESVDEQFRRVFDSLLERVHTEIRAHGSASLDLLQQTVQGLTSRETELVDRARTEGFDAGLQKGRNEAAALLESRTTAAVVEARTEAVQITVSRLLAAVRSLDNATALSHTLETLLAAVRTEARHAGLFLWRNERLRAWGTAEFASSDGVPVTDLNPDDAGVIADAARTASPHLATSPDRWPAFNAASSNGVFAAVPLIMNGQVIAVLCADHESVTEGTHLALTCELLARHAAQHLESLTARRLAQTGAPQAVAAS